MKDGMNAPHCLDALKITLSTAVERFPHNLVCRHLDEGTLTLAHYRTLLITIFHQAYCGPYTFARAGVNCSWKYAAAKEYLIQHAEEERIHWRWILDDLRVIGYDGPDLRQSPPHPTTQAYIGFNYYIAEEVPVARLAIALVLETIGAMVAGTYGRKLLATLNLQRSQATFFLNHADTDKKHIRDLASVIESCELTDEDWCWMIHAAKTAGEFYRAMYDHAGYQLG